jgi:hypothetical protein
MTFGSSPNGTAPLCTLSSCPSSEVNEQSDDQGGVTISCWHRTSFGRNLFLVRTLRPLQFSTSFNSLLRFSLKRYTDYTCAQGRINIPFNTIPYNKNISRWFPLHPTHGRKSNVHGEISLNLHFKVCACATHTTHTTHKARPTDHVRYVMIASRPTPMVSRRTT